LAVEAEAIRFFNVDPNRSFNLKVETAIEAEFRLLSRQWKSDTRGISSISDMVMHPAYQRIIGMGKEALPFILRDLRDYSDDWFHALHYIVGKDVAAGTETVGDAQVAWLEWGYKEGYI